jgi:hypothetical protein
MHAEPDTADTAALLEGLMSTLGPPAVGGHSSGRWRNAARAAGATGARLAGRAH